MKSIIKDTMTIGLAFEEAKKNYSDKVLLSSNKTLTNSFKASYTFEEVYKLTKVYGDLFKSSGYGHGHRIAFLIGNKMEYFIYKIALSNLGISCVPINPDYMPLEIAYVLGHCDAELIITISDYIEKVSIAISKLNDTSNCIVLNRNFKIDGPIPKAKTLIPISKPVNASTEASLLYTSGSTSKPKGCILSHDYEISSGLWYASRKGLVSFNISKERIFNPLPVHHINSSVFSFFASMFTGNCQIVIDRFHPKTFWEDVVNTEATVIHYLGVMVPILLNQKKLKWEKMHKIRIGIGAGIEPSLHRVFEERFNFPMIEIWGMTEMVRCMFADTEPRQVGTRAFGKPEKGLEVNDKGIEAKQYAHGEMLIRYSQNEPRRNFFKGYLKDPLSTEQAWKDEWFHTGDIVYRDDQGMLHFVDRKKNIIRRSGENISAAEIENILQIHNKVHSVTVIAVKDEIREEEVMACVVLKAGYNSNLDIAKELFLYCLKNISYYKAPGWILFLKKLPMTSTNKIAKFKIFKKDQDPRKKKDIFDFRNFKKRNTMEKT